MLSQEIGVSSNLVSYRKGKPARFLETVTLCEAFRGNFQKNRLQSLLSYDISAYLFLCLHLFNISVRLFSILLSLCNTIFSFSFKHNEHLLLLVLYAWCLPKTSHVMFVLCQTKQLFTTQENHCSLTFSKSGLRETVGYLRSQWKHTMEWRFVSQLEIICFMSYQNYMRKMTQGCTQTTDWWFLRTKVDQNQKKLKIQFKLYSGRTS